MQHLEQLILSMSDDECKKWLRFTANKAALKEWWFQVYPGIDPFNVGEIVHTIKYKVSPICEQGNHKKFKQFPKGFFNSCNAEVCVCKANMLKENGEKKRGKLPEEEKKKRVAKYKATCLARYGVENGSQLPDQGEKVKATFVKNWGQPTAKGILEIKEKIIKTNKEKYGVSHFRQSAEYRERAAKTNLEKYGCEHAIASAHVKALREATMIEKYGTDNYFKVPEHQQAFRDQLKQQFGYENPGQRFLSERTREILQDPEEFKKYVTGRNYESAALSLDTSAYTITQYVQKYNLHHVVSKGQGSAQQDLLCDWLTSLGYALEKNNRTIIKPKEIDIYIPEFQLGIEVNGVFYHSESTGGKDSQFHLNKQINAAAKGVKLLHVCSTHIKHNLDAVKSVILSNLNQLDQIGVQQCTVATVMQETAKEFAKTNSIGAAVGNVNYGLVSNNELVQMLSCSTIDNSNNWEIVNIVSKNYTSVDNGLRVLFEQFVSDSSPQSVVYFADNRYYTGRSLDTLEFDLEYTTAPYAWVTDYQRLLYIDPAPNLDELQQNNLDIAWDCGFAVWKYHNTNLK